MTPTETRAQEYLLTHIGSRVGLMAGFAEEEATMILDFKDLSSFVTGAKMSNDTTLADRAREFYNANWTDTVLGAPLVVDNDEAWELMADFASAAVAEERKRIAGELERRLPLDEGKYTTGGWRRWLDSNRELIAELRGETNASK